MIGVNRNVHAPAITHPFGLDEAERRRIVERALELLEPDDALGYPPHQVFVGNLHPDVLWEIERPWWRNPVERRREGPFGELVPQSELYRRMQEADAFRLLRLDGSNSGLPIYDGTTLLGGMSGA